MKSPLVHSMAALVVLAACSTDPVDDNTNREVDDARGNPFPRGLGKADGTNSCVGHCDGQAPAGCWCDDLCVQYGDCCADKAPACDQVASSCEGHCGGKSPDGCWCDELCVQYGDCCEGKAETCDAGPVDCTAGGTECGAGEVCTGIPRDGSSPNGRCVDITPLPGEGDSCASDAVCGAELTCAGELIFTTGFCVPAWMAGSYADEVAGSIPEAAPLSRSVVAYGLATVPVDIVVELDITHPRPSDLAITLTDPNDVVGTVVAAGAAPAGPNLKGTFLVTGIPGDDEVNGRWTLEVTDTVTGQTGQLQSWSLELTSRWD